MHTPRPKVLVVCARNKKRSRTAEHIFKNDPRFNVRSAGLSEKSVHKLSLADLHWADLMFVMETNHRSKVRELYRAIDLPPIEVLEIEDLYEFMDDELVAMLRGRIGAYFSEESEAESADSNAD